MNKLLIKWWTWFSPVLACIVIFLFMHVLQSWGGFTLPVLSILGLSVALAITLTGYVLRLRLLNRIGGLNVLFVSAIIIAGTLLPKETVQLYPEKASEVVARDFDAAWKTVYGRDLFREFSLHQNLMQYAESLSRFDIHRAGQVGLFGLFGTALGLCFLFPIDPSMVRSYWRSFLLVLIAGGLWSLQMELLQILSPTREVTFAGFLESLIGITLGLFFFAAGNLVYVHYKKTLEDRRFNVLGVGIDAVNMGDCLDLFEEIIGNQALGTRHEAQEAKIPINHQASTINLSSGLQTKLPAMTTAMGVAGVVESRRNQKLQRILNESVLNTPDGMPLVWLGKLFGQRRIERVYGPDLLRDVCAYGADKGWRHFFYGAAPGIVEKLKEVLEEKYPAIEIAGIYCPPFRPLTSEEEAEVVDLVNRSNTDIFWIGISTPKQLYFMDHIREKLNCRIICPVGYAFDVNAGVQKDAPEWIKKAGLQWIHRGIKQPRLWKRYLPDNPMFMLKVFSQILHLKKFTAFRHERPTQPFYDTEGHPRFPVGVVSLSAMTLQGARDRIANWIETGQKHYVNFCSVDTVVQCYDRPDLAQIIMDSGMATTDGMPLVWLSRKFGFSDSSRIDGLDMMRALCALSEERGYSHYFYGATSELLGQLRNNLLINFPKLEIAGMYAPPSEPLEEQDKDHIAKMINEVDPDIVWCGLEHPKRDYWAAEFRRRLNCRAILAVGETFKPHVDLTMQSPRGILNPGLERLQRIALEPSRLWRRYIIGTTRFGLQTRRQWIHSGRIRKHMERSLCGLDSDLS